MSGSNCPDMRLLIQAGVDGELSPAETARTEAHLGHCPDCADLQRQLLALGEDIRREVPFHSPPDALLDAVKARLATIAPPVERTSAGANDNQMRWWRRAGSAGPFGGGFALAACLALAFVLPQTGNLADTVVSDHIRALQPGHLTDVVSTDQHTVKPWFDGRLDFAPPVKDFKAAGFPLEGGRLDYLDGKPVAALIYRRGQHIIDLYVWPASGPMGSTPTTGSLHGYNYVRWRENGMTFWAVSDLEAEGLTDFVGMMRTN